MANRKTIRNIVLICLLNLISVCLAGSSVPLPDDLQNWCPYTKFCNLKPSQTVTPNTFLDKEVMFCCEPCSCSNKCGENRNCCTEGIDDYKTDETFDTICKQLVTKEIEGKGVKEHYFHIVDKCPNASENCNEKRVAPWGSYHPLYSRTSGLIYYNTWCAECHNQTDMIVFDAVIQTRSEEASFSWIITDTIFGQSNDSNSFVRFIPSREVNLPAHVCYPQIVRSCRNDSKYYEETNNLCQMFNATYHYGSQAYANIYCFICSHKDMPLEEILKKVRRVSFCEVVSPRTTSKLTFLLNSKTTQLVDIADGSLDDNMSLWCKDDQSNIEENCRRVYCPEGQFRFHGECDYLGNTWFANSVSVLIKLTPRAKIPVEKVQELSEDVQKGSAPNILRKPMLFTDWSLHLLYKADRLGKYVNHFVAHLRRTTSTSFDPKSFLNLIDNSLTRPWGFVLLNTYYSLHAELDTNLRYIPYTGNGTYLPYWLDGYRYYFKVDNTNMTVNESEVLREIYYSLVQEDGPAHLYITRMFFCDQVELFPHEFILDRQNVYLKSQARHMGLGSFVRVPAGNQTLYRVCLSDLRHSSSNGAGNHVLRMRVVVYACSGLFLYYAIIMLRG